MQFAISCVAAVVLVEQVESNAVLPPLHHVVVEGRRVPAVAALPLIGLLAQRGPAHRLPQAVAGRRARAAVVDSGVVVGVGGGGIDALIVAVGAEQVVLVVLVVELLRLQALKCNGGG